MLTKFTSGTAEPNKANQPVIDAAAEWYVYRLTDTILRSDPVNYGKKAGALIEEFDRDIVQRVNSPNVQAKPGPRPFVEKFGPELVKSLKEVFKYNLVK